MLTGFLYTTNVHSADSDWTRRIVQVAPTRNTPGVVEVRLRLLSQGAMRYAPLVGKMVILETKGKIFKEETGYKGWATFREIPCGGIIRITSPDFKLQNDNVWQVTHNLQCTNSHIELSYGDMSGRLLSNEDLKYIID